MKNRNGDEITRWAIEKRITSIEWYRKDCKWWEYCLVKNRNIPFITPLIRIIKIEKSENRSIIRIWGSKSLWLSKYYPKELNEKLKKQNMFKSAIIISK